MKHPHTVIDVFAGPGGLSEGFASFETNRKRPFAIGVSAEMDDAAHSTLALRALFRRCANEGRTQRLAYSRLAAALVHNPRLSLGTLAYDSGLSRYWQQVEEETLKVTLGTSIGNRRLHERLDKLRRQNHGALVLVGGPPCQAYSLVGRARNRGIRGYRPSEDGRHYLYQEYLSILRDFGPDVFIMENVKGLLSSKIDGSAVFQRILEDLRHPSHRSTSEYDIVPLQIPPEYLDDPRSEFSPQDFLLKSEDFGVPQARHRVILMGLRRRSFGSVITNGTRLKLNSCVSLEQTLAGLPPLRSGLNGLADDPDAWLTTMLSEQRRLVRLLRSVDNRLAIKVARVRFRRNLPRASTDYDVADLERIPMLPVDKRFPSTTVANHATRRHMPDDLCRYLYCSTYSALYGRSPTSSDFPRQLKPAHKSWDKGHFADRFRVQRPDRPGSTITSHLAKDGHHFIHWDPTQCRSFTVREAARVQTFPDNYLFLGNRTQQYTQVGNAVPPLLAAQIAEVVSSILRD